MRTVNQIFNPSLPKIKMKSVIFLLFFGTLTTSTPVKKDESLCFDSYGLPCMNKFILNSFQKNDITKISYSKTSIQTGLSLFCGYFCLAFLISDEQGMSLEQFVSLFKENDVKANEKIASQIVKKAIVDLCK